MHSRPLLAAVLAFFSVLPLGAAERVALVIGNDAYQHAGPLANPVSDATAVGERLKKAGYDVTLVTDAGIRQMHQGLLTVCGKAKDAEAVLVFYAGHGMEVKGENYLLPIDAALAEEVDLSLETLSLKKVMQDVNETGARLKVIVLDSCRDDPFSRESATRSWMKRTRSTQRGLAEVAEKSLAEGTMLVFSAAPGKKADDGTDGHSPFTSALLKQLASPGMSMAGVFSQVAVAVSGQEPWIRFDGSGKSLAAFSTYPLLPGESPVAATPTPVMNTAELAARDRQIEELKAQIAKMARESTGRADQAAELAVVKEQLTAIQEQIKSKPAVTMTPAAFPATKSSDQSNTSNTPHMTYTTGLDRGIIGDSRSFEIGGGQKVVLKYVPGGEFLMGSPEGEQDRSDNEKQTRVTLTSHYWMGETEVTQGQWEAVMGSNPSNFKGATLPVEQVSHDDAVAFLGKLNAQSRPASGWRWALPSEAQWERACRGGTETVFSFGDSLDSAQANFNGNYPYGNGKKGPHLEKKVAVKSYAANGYGLYDMHGNVYEWCADWYGETLPGGVDPHGPQTGSFRVFRGGSWSNFGGGCRSAYRVSHSPVYRGNALGFRLAAVPEER